jgi:hypothetical protein
MFNNPIYISNYRFAAMEGALTKIEKEIEPLVKCNLEEMTETLSPLENARLRVTLGYAINSLFYSKLSKHHYLSI